MIGWLHNLMLAFDIFLNVAVLDGQDGETISEHAAKARADGRMWGCVLCRWLSITVERNHCARTLAGEDTVGAASIWAGLQLAIVAGVIVGIVKWA